MNEKILMLAAWLVFTSLIFVFIYGVYCFISWQIIPVDGWVVRLLIVLDIVYGIYCVNATPANLE